MFIKSRSSNVLIYSIFLIVILNVNLMGCQKEELETKKNQKRFITQTVAKLDHVLFVPTEPKKFHLFLHEKLGLPIAWDYMEYGSFASGGVFAGNVNLESIKFDIKRDANIIGLAFEPNVATDELVEKLYKMKVDYIQPDKSYYGWTNTGLKLLDRDKHFIFYCDYKSRRGLTSISRRFDSIGPLGIIDVKYISLASRDDLDKWGTVLYPAEYKDEFFLMLDGPLLKIKGGRKNKIESIIFNVGDLEVTEKAMGDLGILGKSVDGIIYSDPIKTYGIVLGFTN